MPADALVCARCGQQAQGGDTATWSTATGPEGTTRLCGACTREHLRSIEARLDEQWWEPPAV